MRSRSTSESARACNSRLAMLSILSGVSRSKANSRRGASKIASADPKCSRRRAVTRGPTPGVMLRAIQSFIADFRLPIADLSYLSECSFDVQEFPASQLAAHDYHDRETKHKSQSSILNRQSAIGNRQWLGGGV